MMKNFLKVFGMLIAGSLISIPLMASAVGAFIYPQGGTGTTTPSIGQLVWWGSRNQSGVATTTVTCSGSTSCTSFVAIGNSPITISSSAGASATNAVSTSSAETATQVPFWTSTAGTPALLSGGNSTFTFTTAANRLNFTYSSSTYQSMATASTTNHTNSATPATLLSTNAAGLLQTTTVSAPLSFSGSTLSCSTCSTTSGANPTGTVGLTAVNGSALTFLRSDGAPALSQAIAPTWTALHIFVGGATSTSLSVYNFMQIPTSTAPTLSVTGQIAINISAASTSLQLRNGGQFGLYATSSVSFAFSTTSPSTVATDTVAIILGPRGQVFNNMACKVIGASTATTTIAIGSGTATSTYFQASTGTPAPITLSTNNSFNAWQTLYVAIGNYSSLGVSSVSCGFGRSYSY